MLKQFARKFDRVVFGEFLFNRYLKSLGNKSLRCDSTHLDHRMTVQYAKNDSSLINTLCDTYGSDKGEASPGNNPYVWDSHNFADFYSLVFGLKRNAVELVVECGLGTNNPDIRSSMGVSGKPGASLRVWQEYFPNAQIIGCDIDSQILFEEDRIKTFECDQTSQESIAKFLTNAGIRQGSVDIIIDDGLHAFHAGTCFFENMWGALRAGGVYIIEDVTHADLMKYKEYFAQKTSEYEVRYIYLETPNRSFGDDNNLICITQKMV